MINIFIFYFLNKFTFFYAIFIGIMKMANISPLEISIVIVTQELTKILVSSHTGALADKYGISKIITVGLGIKIIGLIIWFFATTFTAFNAGIVLIGIGNACVIGKIDVFIYNFLLHNNQIDKFKNVLLKASIIESFASTLIGIFIIIFHNYLVLSVISILIIMLLQIPFVIFFMKDSVVNIKKYTKEKPSIIIKKAFSIVINDKKILYLVLISALPTSLMILSSDLYKMVIADLNLKVINLGFVYSFAHFLPAVVSIFFVYKYKNIHFIYSLIIMLVAMISYIFGAFYYNKFSVCIIVLFLSFVPICNSLLRNKLELLIANDTRATITSFVGLLTSAINIFGFLLIGSIAKIFNYQYALLIFALIFNFILIMSIKYYRKIWKR